MAAPSAPPREGPGPRNPRGDPGPRPGSPLGAASRQCEDGRGFPEARAGDVSHRLLPRSAVTLGWGRKGPGPGRAEAHFLGTTSKQVTQPCNSSQIIFHSIYFLKSLTVPCFPLKRGGMGETGWLCFSRGRNWMSLGISLWAGAVILRRQGFCLAARCLGSRCHLDTRTSSIKRSAPASWPPHRVQLINLPAQHPN